MTSQEPLRGDNDAFITINTDDPKLWTSSCMSRRSAIGLGVGAAALASAASAEYAAAQGQSTTRAKPVLVFDVNETLLDIDVLNPIFDRIFGVPGRMREWFAQLILYSQSDLACRPICSVWRFGRRRAADVGRHPRRANSQ